jgi:hypothetical protein
METMELTIAGIDYQLEWSLNAYREITKLTGVDFNHLRANIFNEINQLNNVIGKPPAYYAEGNPNEHTLYGTRQEYANALENYNIDFDLEFTTRITEHISMEMAAKIFYAAAHSLNSKVELAEMEENCFIEGIKPNENTSGYQYLVVQYISWTYTVGTDKEEEDAKKSGKGSLLKKLIQSLTT